jgi:hypothetical protein
MLLDIPSRSLRFKLILSDFKHPVDLLNNFDFNYLRSAVYKGMFFSTPTFSSAPLISASEIVLPISYDRYFKSVCKGITVEGADKFTVNDFVFSSLASYAKYLYNDLRNVDQLPIMQRERIKQEKAKLNCYATEGLVERGYISCKESSCDTLLVPMRYGTMANAIAPAIAPATGAMASAIAPAGGKAAAPTITVKVVAVADARAPVPTQAPAPTSDLAVINKYCMRRNYHGLIGYIAANQFPTPNMCTQTINQLNDIIWEQIELHYDVVDIRPYICRAFYNYLEPLCTISEV